MANYTETQADNMLSNTDVNPDGWKVKEHWCEGCEEIDENGNTVIKFKGWRFDLVNHKGTPLEFLLEDTDENADEATRYADAKARIISVEISECE